MPREEKRLHAYQAPVTPRPAATILLLRDVAQGYEVLMTRRSARASFAPGAYVFPGGAVDAADGGEQARMLGRQRGTQSEEQQAYTVAAIREAFEELGVLLAYRDPTADQLTDQKQLELLDRGHDSDFLAQIEAAGHRLAVDRVWWLCHWITDRDLPKRFDARFFVARMPEGQDPRADEGEQFDPVWISPTEALAGHERGDFPMIFPTIRTLRRLAAFNSVDEVIDQCRSESPLWVSSPRAANLRGEVERFSEHEAPYGELELIVPDGRILHSLDWQHEKAVALLKHVSRLTAPNPGMMTGPGTNTYIIGDAVSGFAVIDPGPDDPAHIDRIAKIVGDRLVYALCTHSHPDHSPGASLLQARCGGEILGRASGESVQHLWPFTPDRTIEDGERIRVGDSTLLAIHTPGHASNHLCFYLEEDGLLFSGDHINNGSTVVIGPPDGNMKAYLDALDDCASFLPVTSSPPTDGCWVSRRSRSSP
ncbi:MAG: MBL fold metallo-hydrolase [Burkholderiaceae bacterium]